MVSVVGAVTVYERQPGVALVAAGEDRSRAGAVLSRGVSSSPLNGKYVLERRLGGGGTAEVKR